MTSNVSAIAALLLLGSAVVQTANAQALSEKSTTIVVSLPPGGATDSIARSLAGQLSDQLKRPVAVSNVPGNFGEKGADHVASAPADGYTLLLARGRFNANLMPVAGVSRERLFLVAGPEARASSVNELIALVRSSSTTWFSVGKNTPQDDAALTFMERNRLSAQAITAKWESRLLGGGVITYTTEDSKQTWRVVGVDGKDFLHSRWFSPFSTFGFISESSIKDAGKHHSFKILAVSGTARSASYPDTPTLLETDGMNGDGDAITGIYAPRGTPDEVVSRLSAEIAKALVEPKVLERIRAAGQEAAPMTSTEFTRSQSHRR